MLMRPDDGGGVDVVNLPVKTALSVSLLLEGLQDALPHSSLTPTVENLLATVCQGP